MKLLVFLIFSGCAVKCDESNNYYVIQRPSDEPVRGLKPFEVYWNVPTMQCRSKKVLFESLYQRYGIVQNKNDSFRGEEIVILYDPGLFPAILKDESSGKLKFRNGGVPQEGNLDEHLTAFRFALDSSIPDPEFNGIGVIDFESWRPVFRQNFGELTPYKNVSILIERRLHPWWTRGWVEAEAKYRFERAGREFMQATLSLARLLRPRARWGYYAFPYCFNMAGSHLVERCADNVPKENDQTSWLWSESTALFPSVYSSKNLNSSQLAALIRQRVAEAARVGTGSPILPYFWFKYRDGGFMSEVDLKQALKTMYKSNASGFIIWGSSNDVNTVTKCERLFTYLENVLGPAIAKYTKLAYRTNGEVNVDQNNTNVSTEDPFDLMPSETKNDTNVLEVHIDSGNDPDYDPNNNYTQNIIERLDEEYIDGNKTNSETDSYSDRPKDPNNSIIIEILLSVIGNVQKSRDKELMAKEMVKISRDRKKGIPIHDNFANPDYENIYDSSTASPFTTGKKKGAILLFIFTTPKTPKLDNIVATQAFTSTEVSSTELNTVPTTELHTVSSTTTGLNTVNTNEINTVSTTEHINTDSTSEFNRVSTTELHPVPSTTTGLNTANTTEINTVSTTAHINTDSTTELNRVSTTELHTVPSTTTGLNTVNTTEFNTVSTTADVNTNSTTDFNTVSTTELNIISTTATDMPWYYNTTLHDEDTLLDYDSDYTTADEHITKTFQAKLEEVSIANEVLYTTEVITELNKSSTTNAETGNSMTESEFRSSTTDGTTAVNMGVPGPSPVDRKNFTYLFFFFSVLKCLCDICGQC